LSYIECAFFSRIFNFVFIFFGFLLVVVVRIFSVVGATAYRRRA